MPHSFAMPIVTRFAPSPTGRLHLGHALSAITGFDLAQRHGGRFLLRIEDIDQERCRPAFIDDIFDTLGWLGLTWEAPVLRQSEHLETYREAADRLTAMGLLYPCFATRREIEAAAAGGAVDPDGAVLYSGLHRHLTATEVAARRARDEQPAMRIDMAAAIAFARDKAGPEAFAFTELDTALQPRRIPIDPARWGDAVIQRKGIGTSYHLSVVIDDARQGITVVTRGTDLRPSTDIHRLLQILLDLPEPLYLHHRLLLGPDGRKLAKRDASIGLAELRTGGLTPHDVRAMIGA